MSPFVRIVYAQDNVPNPSGPLDGCGVFASMAKVGWNYFFGTEQNKTEAREWARDIRGLAENTQVFRQLGRIFPFFFSSNLNEASISPTQKGTSEAEDVRIPIIFSEGHDLDRDLGKTDSRFTDMVYYLRPPFY